jgi:hypothetical protein
VQYGTDGKIVAKPGLVTPSPTCYNNAQGSDFMAIQINVQETPNPNSIKISASETIFEGPRSTSLKSGDATDHPLANALLGIEGIDNIFGINDFVTISKAANASWDTIVPKVEEAFKTIYV